jgi:hypothetical protein
VHSIACVPFAITFALLETFPNDHATARKGPAGVALFSEYSELALVIVTVALSIVGK